MGQKGIFIKRTNSPPPPPPPLRGLLSNCTATWKSFLSDEREGEPVNTFAGTCGTAAAEMSIWKWWKHSSITCMRTEHSAAVLSNVFHSVQLIKRLSTGFAACALFLTFPADSWFDETSVLLNVTDIPSTCPWPRGRDRGVVCHLWTLVPRGLYVTVTAQTQCNRLSNLGVSLGSLPASKSAAIFGWQQLPGLFCQGHPEGNNAWASYFVACIDHSQNSVKSSLSDFLC